MKLKLEIGGRILFFLTVILSITAGLWILMMPQTIHEIEANANGGSQAAVETFRQVSFYQAQGWWGVLIVCLFTGLYAGGAILLMRRRFVAGAVLAVASLIMTYLAGFSIGPFFLPAAAALLAGCLFQSAASWLVNR